MGEGARQWGREHGQGLRLLLGYRKGLLCPRQPRTTAYFPTPHSNSMKNLFGLGFQRKSRVNSGEGPTVMLRAEMGLEGGHQRLDPRNAAPW